MSIPAQRVLEAFSGEEKDDAEAQAVKAALEAQKVNPEHLLDHLHAVEDGVKIHVGPGISMRIWTRSSRATPWRRTPSTWPRAASSTARQRATTSTGRRRGASSRIWGRSRRVCGRRRGAEVRTSNFPSFASFHRGLVRRVPS